MFKRLRWMVMGAIGGYLAYLWLKGKAQDARSAVPERGTELVGELRSGVQDVGTRLRTAIAEGREAMAAREDELRREMLGDRTQP